MAPVEAQEVEVMEGMVKGILVQKAQDGKATKREQAPLKITLVEGQEVEVMEGMVKGMLVLKAQEEQATKREQAPLKIALEEIRRITTPIRVMLNATTIISMGIMQVNVGRSRVISQRRMLMC